MSSDDIRNSLEISYNEITLATNNFADENLLTRSPTSSSKVYKGQILLNSGQSINIVTRKYPLANLAFNELMISQYLKHKNIVSIFKVADRNKDNDFDEVFIISKHEVNGSLAKHLSRSTLTWMQRLKICVGVAHALCYIHSGLNDNYSVIHGNIKSSKILLDENWEPKLHGFRYAMRVRKYHLYLTSKYNGSLQYMDPAYENTRGLTHKSDVFSFGVVLFEVLFGREALSIPIPNLDQDHWYFARLARLHYENRTIDDMIDPDLRKQMDFESLQIFSETAYCCLKELRAQRPDMDRVVRRLERALEIQQKHDQTPLMLKEYSTTETEATPSNHFKGKNLDHLRFRLSDIEFATNNFSKSYCIGSGGYGKVYKAKLEHFDNSTSYKDDVISKKYNTVAIKRISRRIDGQGKQGFFAEIEMLSKCKHPNIVSLLGFCDEATEMILVYEYASNGSLDSYLGDVDTMINLNWAQRIQICLDIAHGLSYLHTKTKTKQSIIHRDIKSANILLDDNFVAKIADFGLSRLLYHCTNQKGSTLITCNIAGTEVYLDPEYETKGKLKTKSDIYSFGVVLFEIMCGRLAYDRIYGEKGLPSVARECFKMGTLKNLVDPKIKEADENVLMINGVLNQDSVDTFSKIAFQCVSETQSKRPTIEVVINELEKALYFQKNKKDHLHISLDDIKSATKNFRDDKCIREGRYWKQYEGEFPNFNNNNSTIVAKRFDSKSEQGNHQFLNELKVLLEYKHDNIVALVGYCNEMDEKILVYEHASNGSLGKHLKSSSLKWIKRLQICIDIANGLEFLHSGGGIGEEFEIIHRDLKSGNILLNGEWKAKVCNLETSSKRGDNEQIEHVGSSLCYMDPHCKRGYLTKESDIYSLGMVLIEILSGRLAWGGGVEEGDLVRISECTVEALDKLVFEEIKEHSAPQSLIIFFEIASECIQEYVSSRPKASEVLIEINKALEFQEDYEIWEPKLPRDYKEIIQMSETPEIYSTEKKKDLYDLLTKGILLQQDKLWFSLGNNGERNEMISAKKFSYKKRWLRKWQSIPESRFPKVAQMLDISNLMIQIKIKTQLLSPGVNYGVHLVFKFCGPKISRAKWLYVDLKYKMGSDNLHADFATWREDEWMMIELYRFLNHKKDTEFEVLLESFSQCYCGGCIVFVEGIEFRAIYDNNNVKNDVQQVLKSWSNMDEVQEQSPIDIQEILKRFGNDDESVKMLYSLFFDEQLFSLNSVNGKKHLFLSALGVLHDSFKVNPFHLKLSPESRFKVVVELLPQQVFGIKCKIGSQMLSMDTLYVCYLVFKLSDTCHGLNCPVKVRDVFRWKNKENGILYFKSPSPWNLHDYNWVPKRREDGWMEVIVWKFNSTYDLRNDCIPVHLKLATYQGTMSGLIVCGLEIRPV